MYIFVFFKQLSLHYAPRQLEIVIVISGEREREREEDRERERENIIGNFFSLAFLPGWPVITLKHYVVAYEMLKTEACCVYLLVIVLNLNCGHTKVFLKT